MIPALVLTAGLAVRLRPLSRVRAKAALPVAGLPLVSRILRQLAGAGITDAVLNLHHLPESIVSRIGDGTRDNIRVRYSWEPTVLGSAGGPRKAAPLLGAPTFLVLNGDTLTDLDLRALIADHERSSALVTMAVIPNAWPNRYGGLLADAHGNFAGTVPRGVSTPSLHFTGVQVVEARAFASLEPDVHADSVRTLYPTLTAARPDAVRVYRCASSFFDIGEPADYFRTCRAMATSDAQFIELGVRASVHPSATALNTIVWDDVTIGAETHLDDVIVADGVHVPAGTVWRRAILRRAEGSLGPEEERIGELAVTPLRLDDA